jgi:alkanesulfonate monooxygenase SsuD/methylene tetrahydromethanopterin reductase-like flavin-dependent oxidoreductase (luciferase family)
VNPAFGLNLAATPANGMNLSDEAHHAEALGFDIVTIHPDHPPAVGVHGTSASFDAWTAVSWVAARTATLRVAPSVLGLPYHTPTVLAKRAETLDRLSSGRLVLAIGAGGDDTAVHAFGLTYRSGRAKVEATEEAIDILRGLWSQPQFTYRGQHFSVDGAAIEPRPEHRIPVWLGAFGPRMADLVGRKADGWLSTYFILGPDPARERLMQIREAAHRAGRDPDQIVYGYNIPVLIDAHALPTNAVVAGAPAVVAEELAHLLLSGFTLLNLWPVNADPKQVEQLAAEVRPAVLDRLS